MSHADFRSLPFWQGEITATPLDGGITNVNYLVEDAERKYVVRVGDDIPLHQVMRFNELAASRAALADLTTLLSFAQRHLSPEGHAVFQKGENWRNELAQAREEWQFDAEVLTSVTESQAVLLKIRNIARA